MFLGAFVRKRTEIQTQSKQNIPNNMTVALKMVYEHAL